MTIPDPLVRALRDIKDLRRQAALLVAQNEALRARLADCDAEIARLTALILQAQQPQQPARPAEPRGLSRWFRPAK